MGGLSGKGRPVKTRASYQLESDACN